MTTPKVSVVVCCHNEEKHLPKCLEALKGQTYPNFEIIVVDDGSTDRTAQIAEKRGVKLISIPHSGLPTARNVGVENAEGEVIAFTDADCVVEETWLGKLIGSIRSGNYAGVVGGIRKVLNSYSFIARCLGTHLENKPIKCNTGGYNMAYRKEVIKKLGGFDPNFIRGGDYEFNLRVLQRGYKVAWAKDAIVFFTYPDTINKLITQQLANGFWYRKILKKHPRHLKAGKRRLISTFVCLFIPFFFIRSVYKAFSYTKSFKLTLGFFLYSYVSLLAFNVGFLSTFHHRQ